MQLFTEDQIRGRQDEILSRIEEGAIFIYPTDTVYSLGCNAEDESAVRRLRAIKESEKSFSVIAPSKEWILKNCDVPKSAEEWMERLPGPYTLNLPLRKDSSLAKSVANGDGKVGVRMLDHHFQGIVERFGSPLVTTSANRIGKEIMTHIDRLDEKIKSNVDMVLYEGERKPKASEIVDLTGQKYN